jgi:glucose/arabinose dehydrogenase
MSPRGGDELVYDRSGPELRPLVSEGRQYSGRAIPNHASRPEFTRHFLSGHRSIAPAGMIYYDGLVFPTRWQEVCQRPCVAKRSSVSDSGNTARGVDRWDTGHHIRDVATDVDGQVLLLEDGNEGAVAAVGPQQLGPNELNARTSFQTSEIIT